MYLHLAYLRDKIMHYRTEIALRTCKKNKRNAIPWIHIIAEIKWKIILRNVKHLVNKVRVVESRESLLFPLFPHDKKDLRQQ